MHLVANYSIVHLEQPLASPIALFEFRAKFLPLTPILPVYTLALATHNLLLWLEFSCAQASVNGRVAIVRSYGTPKIGHAQEVVKYFNNLACDCVPKSQQKFPRCLA